jgi:DNA-binding XRE family transcriptional regulator|nr:MAG TPA: Helix-turn-helix XRE-family like protein [Caudoviricetes sp.]
MTYSLKELRARKGLSQLETAEKLGVSVQTYNAWEADFGMVKARNAVKVANLFGVKFDDIYFQVNQE